MCVLRIAFEALRLEAFVGYGSASRTPSFFLFFFTFLSSFGQNFTMFDHLSLDSRNLHFFRLSTKFFTYSVNGTDRLADQIFSKKAERCGS